MGFIADLFSEIAFNIVGGIQKEPLDMDKVIKESNQVKNGKISKGEFYRNVNNGKYK